MRKLIFSVVILLLLFLSFCLVAPYFVGIIGEKTIKTMVVGNHQAGNVTVVNYHRHWFSSTAELKITSSKLVNAKPVVFDVNLNIKHGPYFFSSSKVNRHWLSFGQALLTYHASLNQADNDLLIAYYHGKPALTGDALIAFNRDIVAYFQINPTDKNNQQLVWQGLSANFQKRQKGTFHLQLTSTPLTLQLADKTINIGQFSVNIGQFSVVVNEKRDANGFWLGKSSLTMDKLQVNQGDDNILKMQTVDLERQMDSKADNLNASANLTAAIFNVNNVELGPMRVDLKANHLAANELKQFQASLKKLDGNNVPATIPLLMQDVSTLLNKGALLHADLQLTRPEGKVTLIYDTKADTSQASQVPFDNLDSSISLQLSEVSLHDVLAWYYHKKGLSELNASLSKLTDNIEKSTPEQQASYTIAWLKCAGYVTDKDNMLLSILTYKQQQLLLNAKDIEAKQNCWPKVAKQQIAKTDSKQSDPRIPPSASDQAIVEANKK